MNKIKQTHKELKLILSIFDFIILVSFFGIIICLVMWAWTGMLSFEIFLLCVFTTLFFSNCNKKMKIEIKERLEND